MGNGQQRMLKTMLTGIPGFLVLKNKALVIEVVNPAFCQFLGKAPDEIAGKKDADLFPDEEAKLSAKEDATVLKTGMPSTKEQALTGAEGQKWLHVTRSPIPDDNGDPAGILLFARDATELKKREAALKEGEGQLDAVRKEAEEKAAQAAQAVQAHDAAQAKLKEAGEQFQQLQAQLAEKEQQVAQAQDIAAQRAKLQEQLEAAKDAYGQLQQQAQQSQTQATEAQQASEALRGQLEQVQGKTQELETRLAQMGSDRNEAAALAQQVLNKLQP